VDSKKRESPSGRSRFYYLLSARNPNAFLRRSRAGREIFGASSDRSPLIVAPGDDHRHEPWLCAATLSRPSPEPAVCFSAVLQPLRSVGSVQPQGCVGARSYLLPHRFAACHRIWWASGAVGCRTLAPAVSAGEAASERCPNNTQPRSNSPQSVRTKSAEAAERCQILTGVFTAQRTSAQLDQRSCLVS
jgi:hypothetical protein